jgi:hypothetical protein
MLSYEAVTRSVSTMLRSSELDELVRHADAVNSNPDSSFFDAAWNGR